jgi:hypothetical protein
MRRPNNSLPYLVDRFATWRIELFIKSFFYKQNLACLKPWIWINTNRHPNAMDAWLRYPRFHHFKPFVSDGDSILKGWKLLLVYHYHPISTNSTEHATTLILENQTTKVNALSPIL